VSVGQNAMWARTTDRSCVGGYRKRHTGQLDAKGK
jgi:hypothetical protein